MKKIKIILLLVFAALNCWSQDDNLLIHYKFNGDVLDQSPNAYDGTLIGGSFTTDRFGTPDRAILFDGIDDYIELPNLEELKPNLPVSFSFWVRYDSANPTKQAVFNTSLEDDLSAGVFFNSSSSTGGFAVNFGDGSPFYTSASRRTFVSSQTIELDTWYHIAVVVETATRMTIYVDCEPTSGVFSGTGGELFYSTLPGVIGRHDRDLGVPFEYFAGAIDDFRYFDRALNSNDVLGYCNELSVSDLDITEPDIVLYPNPVESTLNIMSNAALDRVEIYDTSGRLLLNSTNTEIIDTSGLRSGIYYLRIFAREQMVVKPMVVR